MQAATAEIAEPVRRVRMKRPARARSSSKKLRHVASKAGATRLVARSGSRLHMSRGRRVRGMGGGADRCGGACLGPVDELHDARALSADVADRAKRTPLL